MKSFSVHEKSPDQRMPKRFAAWFLQTFIAVAGVAAALTAASLGEVKSGDGPVAFSEPLAAARNPAATTSVTFRGAAVSTMGAQRSFAFGYLEYDWDPNAPGGVPGFD